MHTQKATTDKKHLKGLWSFCGTVYITLFNMFILYNDVQFKRYIVYCWIGVQNHSGLNLFFYFFISLLLTPIKYTCKIVCLRVTVCNTFMWCWVLFADKKTHLLGKLETHAHDKLEVINKHTQPRNYKSTIYWWESVHHLWLQHQTHTNISCSNCPTSL